MLFQLIRVISDESSQIFLLNITKKHIIWDICGASPSPFTSHHLAYSSQVSLCPGRTAQLWITPTGSLRLWLLGRSRSPTVPSWWQEMKECGPAPAATRATVGLSAKLKQVGIAILGNALISSLAKRKKDAVLICVW